MEDFNELSLKNELILEKFIEYLKSKNIKITLLLVPYHPKVFSYVKTNKKYKALMPLKNENPNI